MNIMHNRAASFLDYYPHKICGFFKMFTSVDSVPKRDKYRNFIKTIFTDRHISELFKDFFAFMKLIIGVLR